MSMTNQWTSVWQRAADKWQIPLFGLSLVFLGGSLLRFRPSPATLDPDEAVEHLRTLVSAGQFNDAAEHGRALLEREDFSEAHRVPVHLGLGRALHGKAKRRRVHTAGAGRRIVEHYQEPLDHGLTLTARDHQNIGEAFEWQGRFGPAVAHYLAAIQGGVDRSDELRKHVISLDWYELQAPAGQVNLALDRFLGVLGDERLGLRLWTLERKFDVLEELGRLEEVATLLARYKNDFFGSDLWRHFQYLEALLLHKMGHDDAAERLLRAIRNRGETGDNVHAMTGWLLGRVVMRDGGPQRPLEALSFYWDVIEHHAGDPYAAASRVGAAEALGLMQRHAEALDSYRVAVDEVRSVGVRGLVSRGVLRASLGVAAEAQRQGGRLADAVAYARLAVELVDPDQVEQVALYLQQLGQLQFFHASELGRQPTQLGEPSARPIEAVGDDARAMFAEAAMTFLSLAQLNVGTEERAAEASWRAGELFFRAGQRDRASALYEAFVTEHPQHALVPRALLRVGQLRAASGDLAAAVEAYQTCYRRFPRTLDGSRVLVSLARCYMAMGPSSQELAEKTLRVVLEDSDVFTPEAPEFADALFLLGEVQKRRGDFERAIATLEEALERYPDDLRIPKARFLLADAYRQSGLALRQELEEVTSAGELEQLRARAVTRLQAARRLFRQLITEYEVRDPAELSRLEKAYQRFSYLFEADCFFETQEYRRAIKLYEEAAGAYRSTPSALAAYVQIITSHVFLGESREARAALARARVLAEAMPDEAFADRLSPETRQDWQRYFEWLDESEVF